MKEERLKELLDRYYNSDTSEAEEAELKNIFSGEDIMEGYEAEKEIFRHYSRSEHMPVPSADFKERIFEAVSEYDKKQHIKLFRKRYALIFSAAAVILMLIGSYFIFFSQQEQQDTFTDPQLAYTEIMKILNEVSVKLNKGTEALKPICRIHYMTTGINSMGRSADVISKNLQRIKLLEEISDKGDQVNDKNSKN